MLPDEETHDLGEKKNINLPDENMGYFRRFLAKELRRPKQLFAETCYDLCVARLLLTGD